MPPRPRKPRTTPLNSQKAEVRRLAEMYVLSRVGKLSDDFELIERKLSAASYKS